MTEEQKTKSYQYLAEILYHPADEKYARRLRLFLEKFRLPSLLTKKYPELPKKLGLIFFDKKDEIINQQDESIREPEKKAKYLIVICSKNSADASVAEGKIINEAIIRFSQISEESLHRIIPVLVRDKHCLRATACIPDSVKQLGLLAADVNDKGEERVFSDVVAKMLDLQPDELWNRWERWLRHRRFVRRTAASVFTLLSLGGAFFTWDFCVPKIRYYTDYVEINNIPHGIGNLEDGTLESRNAYYRFTEQYYKLRKVEYLKSDGKLGTPVSLYPPFRNAITFLEYGERGELLSSSIKDAAGKELFKCFYSDLDVIRIQNHTEQLISFSPDFSEVFSNNDMEDDYSVVLEEDIARYTVQRDNQGSISYLFFCNADAQPVCSLNGIWGLKFERDVKGRPLVVYYVNQEGQIITNRNGVSGEKIIYAQDGLIEGKSYVDSFGNIVYGANGYAICKYIWKNGEIKGVRYYDDSGVACCSSSGQAGFDLSYDERGRIVRYDCVGLDGTACEDKRGCASVSLSYLDDGVLQSLKFYNAAGCSCVLPSAISGVEYEFDSCNRLVRMVYKDECGKNSVGHHGCSICRYEYSDDGKLARVSYYDSEDKPCALIDGSVCKKISYGDVLNDGKKVSCINAEGKIFKVLYYSKAGVLQKTVKL